jgi:predicted transcriptional regulator
MSSAPIVTTVRLTPELRAALDAVAMVYRARGVTATRSSILQRAAALGLAAVEREARACTS